MGGSGQLKKYVTESVNEYFAPIRARREELARDMGYVQDVLHEATAAPTRLPGHARRGSRPWAWCTSALASQRPPYCS